MEAEKNAWAICERRRRYWGDRTWQWIARGDLKGFSEALICSAQEQALRTNYTKFHKDDTAESLLCRICRSKGETVAMLRMSAVCWRRQNIQEGMIIWHGISTGNFVVNVNWKELTTGMKQKPEGVVESENFKIMWDFTVQCDRKTEARRPDIFLVDKKEREVVIIDVAIPDNDKVKDKELEKLEKYQLLKDEIVKVWRMRTVIVVLVDIGALGAVSVSFKEYMKRIGVNVKLEVIQKTAEWPDDILNLTF